MDEELEALRKQALEAIQALRKQALEAIQALPEEKRVEMWNIIRYFSARKGATHEADHITQED